MAIDIDEMRRKAEAGSTVSQGILGGLLLYGEDDVPVDYAEAFKWLSLAAAEGAFLPIAHLGYMYEQGLGVEKDMDEAVRLYKDSARRGNSGAAFHLAEMYSQGKGVPVDHEEALRWHLAICYHWDFEDASDDLSEAREYFENVPDLARKVAESLATDPVVVARAGAAKMLGKLVGVSAIPALMKATEDGSSTVRYEAVVALAAFEEWDEAGIPDKDTVTQLLCACQTIPTTKSA